MKITIVDGRAVIDASGHETGTLLAAVQRDLEFHEGRAARLYADAEHNAHRAERVRGQGARCRRLAGELAHESAIHRRLALDSADLVRHLREAVESEALR